MPIERPPTVEEAIDLELRHAALLAAHRMNHLDLHELTTRRREVTQTIAAPVPGWRLRR